MRRAVELPDAFLRRRPRVAAMPVEPSREELEAAHCWEADDRVPGRPAMTVFRRRTRYHQSQWREAHRHPIGTQPIVPRPAVTVRPVGSRVPLDYGRTTGAGFVSPAALAAARARTSFVEREQSFDHQRLWADLLSSEALSFNLFGDLGADIGRADRAVHRWWPDTPGTVRDIRFAHSPGRLDPSYLNSLRHFDAAFVLDTGGGTRAVVAVDVKFFERTKIEQPKPSNAARIMEVYERSARVHARGPLSARPHRPGGALARASPPPLHAPAREPQVDVGPLRGRAPGGQPRRRRLAGALPRLPRRRLDLRDDNGGGPPRVASPPSRDDQGPARPVRHSLSGGGALAAPRSQPGTSAIGCTTLIRSIHTSTGIDVGSGEVPERARQIADNGRQTRPRAGTSVLTGAHSTRTRRAAPNARSGRRRRLTSACRPRPYRRRCAASVAPECWAGSEIERRNPPGAHVVRHRAAGSARPSADRV